MTLEQISSDMDFAAPIFQLLYFIVHFLVSLSLAFVDTVGELRFILHSISNRLWRQRLLNDNWLRAVGADARQFKHRPQHLGIICTCVSEPLDCLVDIIAWAAGYGVVCVSIYDPYGLMKRCCEEFSHKLKEHTAKFRVAVNNDQASERMASFSCTTDQSTITVYLLDPSDGKGDFTSVVRDAICNNESVMPDCISKKLITAHFPDPDLIITSGRLCSSLGFLPWQCRLAEFVATPSVSRMDYLEFRRIMQVFANCEQRFGK